MSTNRIQFQPGLSLASFFQRYGTRMQCQQALFELHWPDGFVCPKCASSEYSRHERGTRLLLQCCRCRRQTSLTAGTVFDASKLPLTTWFLGIHLLTQSKTGMSALQLMRDLGVSYRSAWLLKHKLMQVMFGQERERKLQAGVEADQAIGLDPENAQVERHEQQRHQRAPALPKEIGCKVPAQAGHMQP